MVKKIVNVYVTSAFSKNNKGGNKAGVVLDRMNLTSCEKQEIAKQLGYSETAFVSDSCAADFKIQYFTPVEEVALCGHATIAAFTTLKLLNMLCKQNYTIETKAGILGIQVKEDGLIFMEQNRPTYYDILEPDIVAGCIDKDFIDGAFPIQIVSTGLGDIMIPVDSREHLEELSPDFKVMAELSKQKEVVGVHAFTLTLGSDITAICRNFAPLYGIDEESATGTSNCALACYLFKYHEKKSRYIFEQGHNMGQVSRIIVDIAYHGDVIDSVYVGGYGYLLAQKSLTL
ncbi:MAG: PhzF family phenazine biosynthesis protein [Clostridia bacterium]|nr:PhzF family phenazine biosynthesis protein [Clostridia bacterium]